MRYLDLTLPSLAENLALEEALLEEAETAAAPLETLRIWEAVRLGVVVGRSSRVDVEVRAADCREAGVRVLRRISGGAAVVVWARLPDVCPGAEPAAAAEFAEHRPGPRRRIGHDRRGAGGKRL